MPENTHKPSLIKPVKAIFNGQKIELPEKAGIYAFWWIGNRSELLGANRQLVLKGPAERPVSIELREWWPEEIEYPCLYIGKSTNIKKRFSLHIKRQSLGRLHTIPDTNEKQKPVTTSCQLRYGIEHLFKDNQELLDIIFNNVGFSFSTKFQENGIAERFYTEDLLIGTWRPWFNVDSER